MENKKEENLENKRINQLTSILISLILIAYFFYGFYVDENSAGAGGYNGDFKSIWQNFLLLKEGILQNINNVLYHDSRPPLSYILHILFNPFVNDQFTFRISVLLISLLVPVLLFYSIKQNYYYLDNQIIILLSSIITLSPYFRTSAYWGLGENYGLIFLIGSFLIFSKFKKNYKTEKDKINLLSIFLLCLCSSLTIYFDQKLIFLPSLIFILILNIKINIKFKILAFLFYSLFSLPYIYLIYKWGTIIPPSAASAREVGQTIKLYQLGYCLTILAFYVIPFLLLIDLKLSKIKNKILDKKFLIIILIFSLYLILTIALIDFETLRVEGKGIFHKLSLIIFENNSLRFLFTILAFSGSLVLVYLFFEDAKDLAVIIYFLALSTLTFPFYQEYLDPLFYILVFSFFQVKLKINYRKVYFIFFYFLIFLLGSKYYYSLVL